MEGPGRIEAALGCYRQTLQHELQDPSLEAAQNGAYSLPPQPLLYLHGRNDGCMRVEVAETAGDVLTVPGSRAVMVDGAGHFLQLERPDVVNAEILVVPVGGLSRWTAGRAVAPTRRCCSLCSACRTWSTGQAELALLIEHGQTVRKERFDDGLACGAAIVAVAPTDRRPRHGELDGTAASAAITRPLAWRADPSNRVCGRDTAADPVAGSGSGCPARCHEHPSATGHPPHTGVRGRQCWAPTSSRAWFHAQPSPVGSQASARCCAARGDSAVPSRRARMRPTLVSSTATSASNANASTARAV